MASDATRYGAEDEKGELTETIDDEPLTSGGAPGAVSTTTLMAMT
jgi:hypothetical protein